MVGITRRITLAGAVIALSAAAAHSSSSWMPLGQGIEDGWIVNMFVWEDKLIVAGRFTTAGGQPIKDIAAWDGTQWTALADGMSASDFALHDGKLAVAGRRPDSTVSEIALWDGVAWEKVASVSTGSNGSGNNLASFQGQIYRGSYFGYSQSTGLYWCRLMNLDGGVWNTVEWWSGPTDKVGVDGVAVFDDKLFVHIAPDEGLWSYDGSTWTSHGFTGLYYGARKLIMVGGELFAGGFDWLGDALVARWDGTSPWTHILYQCSSPCQTPPVMVFSRFGDLVEYESKLTLGAWLGDGNGVATWDGDTWTRLPGTMNGIGIKAMAVYDGQLIAAGSFTEVDGVPMAHIAQYIGIPTAVAVTEFTARRSDGGVTLAWELSADEPFDGFHVYRRIDGGADISLTRTPLARTVRSYVDTDVTPGNRYSYALVAVGTASGDIHLQRVEVEIPPITATLHQNVPNPFNPETTIRFTVAEQGQVTIAIYNATGRRVRTLVDAPYAPGEWSAQWDGTDERGSRVASGVYYYRMLAGHVDLPRKMVLLK